MALCCCGEDDGNSVVITEKREFLAGLRQHGLVQCPPPQPVSTDPLPETAVYLSVYSLLSTRTGRNMQRLGLGVFHCGVVIYGIEWGYGEAVDVCQVTGLFCVAPGEAAGALHRTLCLGTTTKSPMQVDTILRRLENEWQSDDYHILHHNCNHFAQRFCDLLSTTEKLRLPSWCNRAARLSDRIVPRKLATFVQRSIDEDPPKATQPVRDEHVSELRASVIPRGWYLNPLIAQPLRYSIPGSTQPPRYMSTTVVPRPGRSASIRVCHMNDTSYPDRTRYHVEENTSIASLHALPDEEHVAFPASGEGLIDAPTPPSLTTRPSLNALPPVPRSGANSRAPSIGRLTPLQLPLSSSQLESPAPPLAPGTPLCPGRRQSLPAAPPSRASITKVARRHTHLSSLEGRAPSTDGWNNSCKSSTPFNGRGSAQLLEDPNGTCGVYSIHSIPRMPLPKHLRCAAVTDPRTADTHSQSWSSQSCQTMDLIFSRIASFTHHSISPTPPGSSDCEPSDCSCGGLLPLFHTSWPESQHHTALEGEGADDGDGSMSDLSVGGRKLVDGGGAAGPGTCCPRRDPRCRAQSLDEARRNAEGLVERKPRGSVPQRLAASVLETLALVRHAPRRDNGAASPVEEMYAVVVAPSDGANGGNSSPGSGGATLEELPFYMQPPPLTASTSWGDMRPGPPVHTRAIQAVAADVGVPRNAPPRSHRPRRLHRPDCRYYRTPWAPRGAEAKHRHAAPAPQRGHHSDDAPGKHHACSRMSAKTSACAADAKLTPAKHREASSASHRKMPVKDKRCHSTSGAAPDSHPGSRRDSLARELLSGAFFSPFGRGKATTADTVPKHPPGAALGCDGMSRTGAVSPQQHRFEHYVVHRDSATAVGAAAPVVRDGSIVPEQPRAGVSGVAPLPAYPPFTSPGNSSRSPDAMAPGEGSPAAGDGEPKRMPLPQLQRPDGIVGDRGTSDGYDEPRTQKTRLRLHHSSRPSHDGQVRHGAATLSLVDMTRSSFVHSSQESSSSEGDDALASVNHTEDPSVLTEAVHHRTDRVAPPAPCVSAMFAAGTAAVAAHAAAERSRGVAGVAAQAAAVDEAIALPPSSGQTLTPSASLTTNAESGPLVGQADSGAFAAMRSESSLENSPQAGASAHHASSATEDGFALRRSLSAALSEEPLTLPAASLRNAIPQGSAAGNKVPGGIYSLSSSNPDQGTVAPSVLSMSTHQHNVGQAAEEAVSCPDKVAVADHCIDTFPTSNQDGARPPPETVVLVAELASSRPDPGTTWQPHHGGHRRATTPSADGRQQALPAINFARSLSALDRGAIGPAGGGRFHSFHVSRDLSLFAVEENQLLESPPSRRPNASVNNGPQDSQLES